MFNIQENKLASETALNAADYQTNCTQVKNTVTQKHI